MIVLMPCKCKNTHDPLALPVGYKAIASKQLSIDAAIHYLSNQV
jgi:hypothetical protein